MLEIGGIWEVEGLHPGAVRRGSELPRSGEGGSSAGEGGSTSNFRVAYICTSATAV
jgi:hypothetical protein